MNEDKMNRRELIEYRSEMMEGLKGYVFYRHLNYGRMTGAVLITVGVVMSLMSLMKGSLSLIPVAIVTFSGAFYSLKTHYAAHEVERLTNAINDEDYEDKLATYDNATKVQHKFALIGLTIGTIIGVISSLIIMGNV